MFPLWKPALYFSFLQPLTKDSWSFSSLPHGQRFSVILDFELCGKEGCKRSEAKENVHKVKIVETWALFPVGILGTCNIVWFLYYRNGSRHLQAEIRSEIVASHLFSNPMWHIGEPRFWGVRMYRWDMGERADLQRMV